MKRILMISAVMSVLSFVVLVPVQAGWVYVPDSNQVQLESQPPVPPPQIQPAPPVPATPPAPQQYAPPVQVYQPQPQPQPRVVVVRSPGLIQTALAIPGAVIGTTFRMLVGGTEVVTVPPPQPQMVYPQYQVQYQPQYQAPVVNDTPVMMPSYSGYSGGYYPQYYVAPSYVPSYVEFGMRWNGGRPSYNRTPCPMPVQPHCPSRCPPRHR